MGHLHIYRVTNLVNGKTYIGRTCRNPPARRWHQHLYAARGHAEQYPLHRAIAKYGEKNFRFEVIAEFDDREKWIQAETDAIAKFRSHVLDWGYNVCVGGESGGPHLDTATVNKVRRLYATGEYTHRQLAWMLGINVWLCKRAIRGYDTYSRIGTQLPRAKDGRVKRPAFAHDETRIFSADDVAELRREVRSGKTCRQVAKARGVSRSVIDVAVHGRSRYAGMECAEPPVVFVSRALTPSQIEEIQRLYQTGWYSYERLASMFATSTRAARCAVLGLGRYGQVGRPLRRALSKREAIEARKKHRKPK